MEHVGPRAQGQAGEFPVGWVDLTGVQCQEVLWVRRGSSVEPPELEGTHGHRWIPVPYRSPWSRERFPASVPALGMGLLRSGLKGREQGTHQPFPGSLPEREPSS